MGETRVDLHHLLEDLRDAYPGSLEETTLTEIVANSLDSGARAIRLICEPASATFVAIDDGSGMKRRDLARYHDIASSSKTRGQGIGFAGVGIKLGLLLCEDVVTETRRASSHVATRWRLASKHKAPWHWEPPAGRVGHHGTAIQLKLNNPLSPLLDPGFVEGALRRHFEALLDPAFAGFLAGAYPHGIRFEINGDAVTPEAQRAAERATLEVRLARKRKPAAIGFLFRESLPLGEDRRGLAISTRGKTIRRGWDWLGVTPATPDRIGGLIEVPALAECLTLNKADFIRSGPRGATYLAFRKAIQEVVVDQLAEWGDARDAKADTRRRAARPVERDLERVLIDLADEFPLLSTLVERREGGQRRLPIGSGEGAPSLVAAAILGREASAPPLGVSPSEDSTGNGSATGGVAEAAVTTAVAEAPAAEEGAGTAQGSDPGLGAASSPHIPALAAAGARRPARYGLQIQFEPRPDDSELARLIESTVWINESHPAFRRAAASRSEGYHLALSVAMALAPLAVEPDRERSFVTSFLEHWGDSVAIPRRGGRRA